MMVRWLVLVIVLTLPAMAGAQGLLGVQSDLSGKPALTPTATVTPSARPPPWPGRKNDQVWSTGSKLTDQDCERVVRTFVVLVVLQLKANAAGREITFEDLMSELCSRWVSETPYGSNNGTLSGAWHAPGAIKQGLWDGKNDWRMIIRRGWGICGDHQQLLLHMVDIALATRTLAHLRPERDRVQELSVVGDGRFGLEPLAANHAAVGLVATQIYRTKVKTGTLTRRGDELKRWNEISEYDVLVYDLWKRPPICGTTSAGPWAVDYIAFNFKTVIGLARKTYLINFGALASWEAHF